MTPPALDAAGALVLGVVIVGDVIAWRRRRSARRSVDTYLQWVLADLAEPPRPRRPRLTAADRTVPDHPSPPRAPLTRPSPPPPVGALARVEQP